MRHGPVVYFHCVARTALPEGGAVDQGGCKDPYLFQDQFRFSFNSMRIFSTDQQSAVLVVQTAAVEYKFLDPLALDQGQ